MKTALYHQEHREPQTFDVLAEHENGTLDLGRGEVLVIGKCPVSGEPKPGFATLIEPEDAEAKKAAADKKAAEQEAKKLADAEAKKAAADKKAAELEAKKLADAEAKKAAADKKAATAK